MQGYANVNMAGYLCGNGVVTFDAEGNPSASFCVAVRKSGKVSFIDAIYPGDECEDAVKNYTEGCAVKITGYLKQQRWRLSGFEKTRLVVEVVGMERA